MPVSPRITPARVTFAAAVLGSIAAPVTAVAYLHTSEGIDYLDQPSIAAWVNPATGLLQPVFDQVGIDRTYLIGTQLLAVLWPVTVAGAITAARDRGPAGRERVWWLITLIGYGWFALGLVAFSVLAGVLSPAHAIADLVFLAGMLPGLLISLIGSTLLGISLLRRRYPARATAWLLTLAIPCWLVANLILGHNSIGLLPLMWAWALALRSPVEKEGASPRRSDDRSHRRIGL